jgi:hypothetical protein
VALRGTASMSSAAASASASPARRTRSTTAAATALLRLSSRGCEWDRPDTEWTPYDYRRAINDAASEPPPYTRLIRSPDYLEDRYGTPPRSIPPEIARRWDEVPTGRRIVATVAQWLTDRFGANAPIVQEVWGVMPFIPGPDPGTPLPEGWARHVDEVGRRFYVHGPTGERQWGRPQGEPVADTEDSAEEEEPQPRRRSPRRRPESEPVPVSTHTSVRRSRRLAAREARARRVVL